MNSRLANIVSVVFHPLMMATYLFSALIIIEPMMAIPSGLSKTAQWLIVLVVWLTTFAIPAMSLVLLKFTGNIASLKLQERKERLIPFFYVTLFYAFTAYYFSKQMLVTELVSGIFMVTAIMILIAAIITIFWKISVHSLGMGGMVGILLVLKTVFPESTLYYFLLVTIMVAGLVLTARLKLQAHSTSQVYSGFVLGLVVGFMLIFWV